MHSNAALGNVFRAYYQTVVTAKVKAIINHEGTEAVAMRVAQEILLKQMKDDLHLQGELNVDFAIVDDIAKNTLNQALKPEAV